VINHPTSPWVVLLGRAFLLQLSAWCALVAVLLAGAVAPYRLAAAVVASSRPSCTGCAIADAGERVARGAAPRRWTAGVAW
jgi:hypothetical protein